MGVGAVGDEVGDAVGEGFGLTGASASQDKKGAEEGFDGLFLSGI